MLRTNEEAAAMTLGTDIVGNDVGDNIGAEVGQWTFGQGVAGTFDSHIARSVPGYSWGHDLTVAMSKYFAKPNGLMYELGCSTGTLSARLADEHRSLRLSVVGIDVEDEMVRHAAALHSRLNLTFELGD
ncbi:MAG: methyltransferase domain-containing protein [Candidatus Methylomirabilaceae bacterium]